MLRFMIASFVIIAAAPSLAAEVCNSYKARDYDIRIIEEDRTMIVSWERYTVTLEKVITKPWGVLQESGVDMEEQGQPDHPFMREKIGGKDAIILDSIVFFKDCK